MLLVLLNKIVLLLSYLDPSIQTEDEGSGRGVQGFNPLAMESLGGWPEVGEREVIWPGTSLAGQTGQLDQIAISRLFQKLFVLI